MLFVRRRRQTLQNVSPLWKKSYDSNPGSPVLGSPVGKPGGGVGSPFGGGGKAVRSIETDIENAIEAFQPNPQPIPEEEKEELEEELGAELPDTVDDTDKLAFKHLLAKGYDLSSLGAPVADHSVNQRGIKDNKFRANPSLRDMGIARNQLKALDPSPPPAGGPRLSKRGILDNAGTFQSPAAASRARLLRSRSVDVSHVSSGVAEEIRKFQLRQGWGASDSARPRVSPPQLRPQPGPPSPETFVDSVEEIRID